MKVLGVEFAPLNVPLDRRFQTFAVSYYATEFLFIGFGTLIFLIYLLFTSYYYLPLIYFTWHYYDRNVCNEGGRTSYWFRNLNLWKHFARYFPIKLIKTAELDPSKNYILGYHPHGLMVAGGVSNFCTEGTEFSNVFPGMKPHLLTLEGQFSLPLHREFLLASGAAAATKASIEWFLTKGGLGNALVIVIGGAEEALDARPGDSYRLTVHKRKGFVKLAIRHGAPLVPVFSFGENDLFYQVNNPKGTFLRSVQDKMTKVFGFSPPLFHGRGVFNYSMGYLPFRKPIVTIVGKPIELKQTDRPSGEMIEEVHQQYLQGLKDIFDAYKDKYGVPDQELIFA